MWLKVKKARNRKYVSGCLPWGHCGGKNPQKMKCNFYKLRGLSLILKYYRGPPLHGLIIIKGSPVDSIIFEDLLLTV
jgi:hypothetical protein